MNETVLRDHATAAAPSGRAGRAANAVLSLGGLLAALATSSCCLIPFVLFSLGISGAWIGNLTALSPFQPLFFAISAGLIGLGVLQVWRRERTGACRPGTPCADPRGGRATRIALWVAGALTAAGMGFPWAFRLITGA